MSIEVEINLTVNGERVRRRVEARRHLVDFLRLDLGLMGTHTGCEHGACGACTVRVDGRIARGCLVLAASLDGASIETIEGLSDSGEIRDLQDAFVQRNASRCGGFSSRWASAPRRRMPLLCPVGWAQAVCRAR